MKKGNKSKATNEEPENEYDLIMKMMISMKIQKIVRDKK